MFKILLVNDCKFENIIMRDMLTNLGHEVIISNEFNVFSDVRELSCNVVISNFIMKEKTGDKILQQIKYMYPKIKCILSSSNNIKLMDFSNKAIDAVIHTPVTKEKLEKALKENINSLNEDKIQMKSFFCSQCGEKLNDSHGQIKFCKYCGKKV